MKSHPSRLNHSSAGRRIPTTANLGFPRIGANRELKRALEDYWRGATSAEDLQATARELRARHWRMQQEAGIEQIPSNDFSFYDQVLDTAAMVGAVPQRYGWEGKEVDLATYFAMARGVPHTPGATNDGRPAMEMTKWFDTNYHYIVPELHAEQAFTLSSQKPIDEFLEAKGLGIVTRPVLIGPVSFLLLSKVPLGDVRPLDLLDRLLPVYAEVLGKLKEAGAEWVQIDEPRLVCDLDDAARSAFGRAYATLAPRAPKILLATYFGGLDDNLDTALGLPVAGLHVDLVRAPGQLEPVLAGAPPELTLSLGVIDGRNVWRADLEAAAELLRRAVAVRGADQIMVGPSCSLLHVPVDLDAEEAMDEEVREWLAFARQKLAEIRALAAPDEHGEAFAASRAAWARRGSSPRIHNEKVGRRLRDITPDMLRRRHPFAERKAAQQERLRLPLLPTTTIGSFPQTPEVRQARSDFQNGKLSAAEYDGFIAGQIDDAIRFQEEAGLDVLVHGEPERSDMVEYFGERLEGFLFTRNGWVQSYGSRCVRPPIIYGDVSRPQAMTVRWSEYAQSRTNRPMKGMLTGPVTILQWSFVRDDQPRSETCHQIALALRDEVVDLARAGLPVIQIDEPALREGLPLRQAEQPAYLQWAVDAFRLAASGVDDDVQIHTHMCYAEFGEIVDAIAAMDADVISMESSRSKMELLAAFREHAYPNDVGPGIYDIHSPRVPSAEEQRKLLELALQVIPPDRLWVNPDCGLKTRRWEEVRPALAAMVQAAQEQRTRLT